MLRKISHIFIVVVLLSATTGFTIHEHYCRGNLIETSVFHEPEFCCGEGSNCCSNFSQTFKLEDDFLNFIQFIDFEDFAFEIPEISLPYLCRFESQSKPLAPQKIFRPPDLGTELARLQAFTL